MSWTTWVLAALVGLLFTTGVYLLLQRSLTRIILGLALLAHGGNLVLLAAAGRPGAPPLIEGSTMRMSDPLPQAMALTAIVISFGVTAFLAAMAYRSNQLAGTDEVEDDIEDRRIARVRAFDADDPDLVHDEDDAPPEAASDYVGQEVAVPLTDQEAVQP